MFLKIYTIYDSAAEAWLPPFFRPTAAMAQRDFANNCQIPDHSFTIAPGDYTLYEIGSFDDQSAVIEPQTPTRLMNGLEAIKKE